MKQRLMIQATNVSSRKVNNDFQVYFNNSIENLEVLSLENWPDIWTFSMMMKVFGVYHECFKLIQIYLFEVFMSIKQIKKLTCSCKSYKEYINIWSFIFINLHSLCYPPLEKFDSKSFVKSWIIRENLSATGKKI